MRRLSIIFGALSLSFSSPVKADTVDRWQPYVAEASLRFGIPESWIKRVMRAESGGQITLNGRPIRSHAGAMGLMQIMPATWTQLRRAHDLGTNPDDPRDNILAGTAYLRDMYDRFGYPDLFAAYNAGPARYRAYLLGRRRLPTETIEYVLAVTGRSNHVHSGVMQSAMAAQDHTPDRLFYAVQSPGRNHSSTPQVEQNNDLFVIRRSGVGNDQ